MRRAAEWVWYAPGALAGITRTVLSPLSGVFGAVVAQRNRAFDVQASPHPLPAISVGNLTVGGTGKTPVASWFTRRLAERGASPAIVLRGYGDDEWRVHRLLTPYAPVVRNADRVAAMLEAKRLGADVAVLDDAFQHRRAGRVSDVVLISADRFPDRVRLLPAGPFREGLAALERATAVVVTVKAATMPAVEQVLRAIGVAAPRTPVAMVRLAPEAVRQVTHAPDSQGAVSENSDVVHPLGWLAGRRMVLTSAIADAGSFERQIDALGVQLVRHVRFPDHHDFSEADIGTLIAEGGRADGVLCTLKDAVKLAPRWPREAAPLWYVSQTLVVDRGAEVLERECDRVLAARTTTIPTAG